MPKKIPVTSDNKAAFSCPQCSWAKSVDVTKYLHVEKEIRLKIRCKCGHTYTVALDRRKFFRKGTDFYGTYVKVRFSGTVYQEKTGVVGQMTVTDLSRGGLRFQVKGKMNLASGDTVQMEFHLDDRNRSRIRKRGNVRSAADSSVGVEFTMVDPTDSSDAAIGYYLFAHCKG